MTSPFSPDRQAHSVALTRVIAVWHQTHAINTRMGRHLYEDESYRAALAWLNDVDMEDPGAQRRLARMQVSGPMEWAYSQTVPPELWDEVSPPDLKEQAPETLGEAGRRLLNLLEGGGREPEEPSRNRDDGERVRVRVRDREDLVRQARASFPDVVADEASGLGGLNFLISSSLERSELSRHSIGGAVTLFGPTALGAVSVQLGDETDLVNLVRSGAVEVAFAIGESSTRVPAIETNEDAHLERRREEELGF